MIYYIWTLDAHELYGPFMVPYNAHEFAHRRGHSTYVLVPDDQVSEEMLDNLRNVPVGER